MVDRPVEKDAEVLEMALGGVEARSVPATAVGSGPQVGRAVDVDDGAGGELGPWVGQAADAGEPDLAGVDVVITDSQGNTQTVTTDANGDYSATVPAGSTTADVDESTLPAGSVQTAGADPTTIDAIAGQDNDLGDDGYQPQGTLNGHIFEDTNGYGIQDAGEPDGAVTDVVTWELFDAGSGQKIGESQFHISCSDVDTWMDGSEDCMKKQGNGKWNAEGLINRWRLDGLGYSDGSSFRCSTQ